MDQRDPGLILLALEVLTLVCLIYPHYHRCLITHYLFFVWLFFFFFLCVTLGEL